MTSLPREFIWVDTFFRLQFKKIFWHNSLSKHPPCNAQVSDLDDSVLGEKDVLSFKVSVQNVLRMQILQAFSVVRL